MAILYPDFETIINNKVKPEPGELYLLNFLISNLDNSFEIFFNPMLNGDRPDFVILRKGFGVLIIEVKDYNLNSYKLDNKKNWTLNHNGTRIKSPLTQTLKYKENLFNLHIPQLLEKQINNYRLLNIVNSAIYFHNANIQAITDFIVAPFAHDNNYLNFIKYNITFLGRDSLNEFDFDGILKKLKLKSNYTSALFSDDLYNSFKRFLSPPIHLVEQGKSIPYSKRQIEIIYSQNREQRIKGVVGSGKTTILAARAVQAYKRTKGNVLILTYNITLKNYIHDKISQVREEFPWANFIILNYHNFINHELNNFGIPVEVPEFFDGLSITDKEKYFEANYYSNKNIFKNHLEKITKYDAIFIDEIQDYKRSWMEIVKEFYLIEGGEYVLFGDVKQNIYNNKIESKDVSANVRSILTLKDCFRSDFKIKNLAIKFQENIFQDKYEIDDFNLPKHDLRLDFQTELQGYVNYIYLQNTDTVSALYTIIHENIINKNYIPNDITILSHSIALLKKFDTYYRYSSNEKTNTMFETSEMVYNLIFSNYKRFGKTLPQIIQDVLFLIKRNNDQDLTKAFIEISKLFTLYDLIMLYPQKFESIFDWYCNQFKTNSKLFQELIIKHKIQHGELRKNFTELASSKNAKFIRDNKKLHFHMNRGTLKLSTVHSFKGWESETIFLIIEKSFANLEDTFDEILYTGLTRSRKNLIIINFGNEIYNQKLRGLVEIVNS